MTPEAQNIAIAEALGRKYHKPSEEEVKSGSYYQYEPDYTRDLNAIHEAEASLSHESLLAFDRHLSELFVSAQHQHCIHATAAQRAEAFLKTIGKWVEE